MLINRYRHDGQEQMVVHVDADIPEIIPKFLQITWEDMLVLKGAVGQQSFETVR